MHTHIYNTEYSDAKDNKLYQTQLCFLRLHFGLIGLMYHFIFRISPDITDT